MWQASLFVLYEVVSHRNVYFAFLLLWIQYDFAFFVVGLRRFIFLTRFPYIYHANFFMFLYKICMLWINLICPYISKCFSFLIICWCQTCLKLSDIWFLIIILYSWGHSYWNFKIYIIKGFMVTFQLFNQCFLMIDNLFYPEVFLS